MISINRNPSSVQMSSLLSAPAATGYYPKIGMKRHEHCVGRR